ncbi:MAG: hypothetical protein GX094_09345, partial [Clostridiales bacterium]|nr:hypothetical protein [Clostridiales bacterium]
MFIWKNKEVIVFVSAILVLGMALVIEAFISSHAAGIRVLITVFLLYLAFFIFT